METFPRPDIASGIFFEYLRYDDPISPELRERVVDGFPFLLAPLSQVKGVSMSHTMDNKTSEPTGNPFVRFFSNLSSEAMARSSELVASMEKMSAQMMEHAENTIRSMSSMANNAGKEFDRRRGDFLRQAATLPRTLVRVLARDKEALETVTQWVASNITPEEPPAKRVSPGRIFGYPLSKWFSDAYYAPDEIGPMIIHPKMDSTRKIFLALVHLYLLLLLIVSFPGSVTTRTKLVVRKSCARRQRDKSLEDQSADNANEPSKNGFFSRARHVLCEEESNLKKKSLSYYL